MVGKPKKDAAREEMTVLQTPRGMHDVLPPEQPWWERIERVSRELAVAFNFGRLETPTLEFARLFERGVGGDTDIVVKEMYTLRTTGGDLLALRPEGTAPVMRAYLEHHLGRESQPQKLWYLGPFFRHESPQAGRFRQFHQVGFEIIGGQNDPIYDAQIILVFQRLLDELKIRNTTLNINSIGCRLCRPLYKRQLLNYYKNREKQLCDDCKRRLKTNPLRLLDCRVESCKQVSGEAPNILDRLCALCITHLKAVFEYLDELSISYAIDNHLVRGLDYYSRTVFEFSVEGPGAEVGALPAGGRYDYLAELLGARSTPGTGGACGIERLIHVLKAQQAKVPQRGGCKVFLIHVGELAKRKSLPIMEQLRVAGIPVTESLGRESLRAQLHTADREGAELALLLGQREIFEGSIIVRDLKSSLQETVPLPKLVGEIKKRLRT